MNDDKTVSLKLENELLERVKNYMVYLGKQVPGATFSQAAAIRALLLKGLAAHEAELAKPMAAKC